MTLALIFLCTCYSGGAFMIRRNRIPKHLYDFFIYFKKISICAPICSYLTMIRTRRFSLHFHDAGRIRIGKTCVDAVSFSSFGLQCLEALWHGLHQQPRPSPLALKIKRVGEFFSIIRSRFHEETIGLVKGTPIQVVTERLISNAVHFNGHCVVVYHDDLCIC